jgi:hypothetical protein
LREIYTEIEIAASPSRVWEILSDFTDYGSWNPFIREIEGEAKEGAKLTIHLTTPGGANRTYQPKVTMFSPPNELRWFGKVPGFLSGEHIFNIKDEGNGRVKFIHKEIFGGLFSSFFKDTDDVKAGFNEMNIALKKKAES